MPPMIAPRRPMHSSSSKKTTVAYNNTVVVEDHDKIIAKNYEYVVKPKPPKRGIERLLACLFCCNE